MNTKEIELMLFEIQDQKYASFQARLIPTVESDRIIGVRTPDLRKLARRLYKDQDISLFLNNLPHPYFEEDQLHAFVISLMKDFDECIRETERFLPYINNWATCDQLSPTAFKKDNERYQKMDPFGTYLYNSLCDRNADEILSG